MVSIISQKFLFTKDDIQKTELVGKAKKNQVITAQEKTLDKLFEIGEEESDKNSTLENIVSKVIFDDSKKKYTHMQKYYMTEGDVILSILVIDKSGNEMTTTEDSLEAYKDAGNKIVVLVYEMINFYSYTDKIPEDHGGSSDFKVITFTIGENGEYVLEEYWQPEAGENYYKNIMVKFPQIPDEVLYADNPEYTEELSVKCYDKAVRHGWLRKYRQNSV
jgi:hypothetical protein